MVFISVILKNLINTIIVLLSVLPFENLKFTPHLVFVLSAFVISTLVREEIISLIILGFGLLYSFTFTNVGIVLLLASILIYIMKKRNSNELINLTFYFMTIAIFNNMITPFMAFAFVLFNLNKFGEYINTKKRFVLLTLLAILLLLPLPQLGLKIENLSKSFQVSKSVEYNQKTSISTENQANIEENKTLRTQENKVNQQKALSNFDITIQDKLSKMSKALAIIFSGLLALYTIFLTFKADKKDRPKIWTAFFITNIILILSFAVLNALFTEMSKNVLPISINQYQEKSYNSESSNSLKEVFKERNNVENPSASNRLKESFKNPNVILTLSIIGYSIVGFSMFIAIWYTTKKFFKAMMEKVQENEENNTISEATVYTTNYSYDEILKLNDNEFVEHSYLYVRKTFYPEYDYLTPYELYEMLLQRSEALSDELRKITNAYVNLKYALRKTFSLDELAELKNIFIKICQKANFEN
ncbi:MAG: hypothetical protein ACK4E1_00645 [Fervidobacterium nodosum]